MGLVKTKLEIFKFIRKENMVFKKATEKTTLTIVNYNDYQDIGNHEETTKRPPQRPRRDH